MLTTLVALSLLAPAAAPHAPAAAPPSGIVFIEDDYQGARARARAEKKPLFLDSWATWCHSCLSMRSFVFPDAGLRPAKDAVVWLSVETEAEKNRAVVEKFPADGLPTFLLIDPDTEQVIGRWLGTSSVNEMRQFVLDTTASWRAAQKGVKVSEAARAEQQGHAAQQKKDYPAAAADYRRALALSARNDPMRPARVACSASALARLKTPEGYRECVALATAELAGMPASPPGADVASTPRTCAVKAPDAPGAKALLVAALARMDALAGDTKAALSVDDRSDVYANLADQLDELKRHDEAVAAMRKRSAMLEAAAGGHRTWRPQPPSMPTGWRPTSTWARRRRPRTAREAREGVARRLQPTGAPRPGPPGGEAGARGRGRRRPRARAHVPGTAKGGRPGPEGAHPEGGGQGPHSGAPRTAGAAPELPSTQQSPETAQRIEAELKALGAAPQATR